MSGADMEPQLIGGTPCEDCRGTGKKGDGTVCAACEGKGMVAAAGQSPRRFPRYHTDLPVRVSCQEGVANGRCVVIGEGGITAILPEPIPVTSEVRLVLPVPTHPTLFEVRAVVRNQVGLRHGFEFVSLTDAERLSTRRFCDKLASQSRSRPSAL